MFNRKLLVVPASVAVLAFGAAGASADTFLLGANSSNANQGINNNQAAGQTSPGGGGGTAIVNKSNYSPTVSQGASNSNTIISAAPSTTGDVFKLGASNSSVNQGINNNQSANQGNLGGAGGTTIINGSSYTPVVSQGASNSNLLISGGGTVTGDLFVLAGNSSNVGQAINNSQSANQGGGSGAGGVLIINKTGFTPVVSQGVSNTNLILG